MKGSNKSLRLAFEPNCMLGKIRSRAQCSIRSGMAGIFFSFILDHRFEHGSVSLMKARFLCTSILIVS